MFQYLLSLMLIMMPISYASIDDKIQAYILEHPEIIVKALALHSDAVKQERLQQVSQRGAFDIILHKGKKDAQLILYYDYRCGACTRSYPQVESLAKKHPNITTILRPLPLLGGESVQAALMAYDAAKLGQQTSFHQQMIEAKGTLPLVKLAQSMNAAIAERFEDHWAFNHLENNYRQSLALDSKSVPLFVMSVKGKHMMLNGLTSDNSLEQAYQELSYAIN